ncbi:hypothetical protein Scep_014321 [Stephania cephalantha]|uniref:Uncharacterized protein n=1 Tax=Stephania cephalantha TaxID=152367 RepID=A0AAP0J2C4_9MAGN
MTMAAEGLRADGDGFQRNDDQTASKREAIRWRWFPTRRFKWRQRRSDSGSERPNQRRWFPRQRFKSDDQAAGSDSNGGIGPSPMAMVVEASDEERRAKAGRTVQWWREGPTKRRWFPSGQQRERHLAAWQERAKVNGDGFRGSDDDGRRRRGRRCSDLRVWETDFGEREKRVDGGGVAAAEEDCDESRPPLEKGGSGITAVVAAATHGGASTRRPNERKHGAGPHRSQALVRH